MSRAQPIRVLFLCRLNRKRSATAERVFAKDPDLDVRSAGTSEDAMVKVNARMLDWADVIFIMDEEQRRSLAGTFPDHPGVARAVCLDIRDDYHFLDPELVSMLEDRTRPYLDQLKARG